MPLPIKQHGVDELFRRRVVPGLAPVDRRTYRIIWLVKPLSAHKDTHYIKRLSKQGLSSVRRILSATHAFSGLSRLRSSDHICFYQF